MPKYLIVDIDETLVYSRQRFPESIQFIDDEGRTSYTIPRPSAHTFLKAAKEKGWVIISLTQGVVPFQKEVLRATGLLSYFHEVYGWATIMRHDCNYRELRNLLGEDKWVLIDNLPHFMLQEKSMWLGVDLDPSSNFIQCDEFTGGEDRQDLCVHLSKLEELLNDMGR